MIGKFLTALFVFFLCWCNFGFAKDGSGKNHVGKIKIKIQNLVNGEKLVLNTQQYSNANGDKFTVHLYKYYISNIELVTEDGKSYKESHSYHLINEAKPKSKEFILENVPVGIYTSLKFVIGVDSLHNVSGAQSGDLDPINAMFWDWNTGYIMAKFEGYTPDENGKEIAFHIGGYAGKTKVIRKVVIPLWSGRLEIKDEVVPVVNINSDVAEWFKTPKTIDFSKMANVMIEGDEAKEIADNYLDMFTLDHIEQ